MYKISDVDVHVAPTPVAVLLCIFRPSTERLGCRQTHLVYALLGGIVAHKMQCIILYVEAGILVPETTLQQQQYRETVLLLSD